MSNKTDSLNIAKGIFLGFLSIAGFILLLFVLYQIKVVFVYLIIAGVITLMARPIFNVLHNKLKWSNSLSAASSMVAFVFLIMSFFYLLLPILLKQADTISSLNTTDIQATIIEQLSKVNSVLLQYRIHFLDDYLKTGVWDNIDANLISNWFSNFIDMLSSLTIGTFAVLFISFFLLKERNLISNAIISVSPNSQEVKITNAMKETKRLLSRYFIGLTLQLLIMFLLYYTLLDFVIDLNLSSAVLIAFLCAICNIVPYIGPIVGFFIMSALGMNALYEQGLNFQTEIMESWYWIIGGYMTIQLLDNFFNQPMIYSQSVKSHPLEIFLIIIIGGLLFGVIGIILAVPTYTVIKVILKEFFYEEKWVQYLTKSI